MTAELITEVFARGGISLLLIVAVAAMAKWILDFLNKTADEAKAASKEYLAETRQVSQKYVESIHTIQAQGQEQHAAQVAAMTNLAESIKPLHALPPRMDAIQETLEGLARHLPEARARAARRVATK